MFQENTMTIPHQASPSPSLGAIERPKQNRVPQGKALGLLSGREASILLQSDASLAIIVTITPEDALDLLTNSRYDNNRKITQVRVARYAQDMKFGRWGMGETAIVIGCLNGHRHLLNGQHRLTAVFESGLPQDFLVQYRRFNSDAEMDVAYSKMDQGLNRSSAQGLVAIGTAARIGINERELAAAVSAFRLIGAAFQKPNQKTEFYMKMASAEEQDHVCGLWSKEIYSYMHCIKGSAQKTNRLFLRSTVVALGIITMRYAPDRAVEYFPDMAMNNGLFRGSPQHTFHNYLTNNSAELRPEQYHMSAAINCWNAFYQNRALSVARGVDTQFIIAGTPLKNYSAAQLQEMLYEASPETNK